MITRKQKDIVMYKASKTFIIILVLLFHSTVGAFESELPEGEGPWNFSAKVSPLKFFKSPSRQSSFFVSSVIKKGQEINYDQTRLLTIEPGLVKATKSGKMKGRNFGSIDYLSSDLYYSNIPQHFVTYNKGDVFEYLHYRAEGECIIRKNKEIFEIENCPWNSSPNESGLTQIKKEVTEEWIRAIKADGRQIGWLVIDAKTLECH